MPEVRLALSEALGTAYRVEREVRPLGDTRQFVAYALHEGPELLVKVLSRARSLAVDAAVFEREVVHTAERLQHPNLVPPLAAGRARAFVYHSRAFVAGTTLAAWLAKSGALALTRTVEILRAALTGLAHAHAAGVAHGDLTADQVILGEAQVQVADVGIAGAVSRALTAGVAEPAVAGPAGDMAAVATIVRQMLTGRAGVAAEALEGLRTLPRWFSDWLDTRWADAGEALAALRPPPPPRTSGPHLPQPVL